MHDIFEKLTQLQSVDLAILNQKKKIDQKREQILKIQQQIESKKVEREKNRKNHEKERIDLSRLELELKDIEEKLKKSQNRLYSGEVQSGKELTQWKTTMENYEKTKSNLEDQIIIQIEKIEEMQIKAKEKEYELVLQQLEEKIEHFKGEIQNHKSDLNHLIKDRNAFTGEIPPEVYALYEELRKKFPDPVVEMDGDTCRGCHLALPSSIAKRVRKKEELIQCPHCKRLIFFK